MKNKKVEKSLEKPINFLMCLFGLILIPKEFKKDLRSGVENGFKTENVYKYKIALMYLYQLNYALLFAVMVLYFYLPYLFIGLITKSSFGFDFFFFNNYT